MNTQSPLDELVAFLKRSDNYTQDTREWPDPTEPRASHPPEPKGCTCHLGDKLDCPIHGLNADIQWTMDNDHTWSLPQNHPVGYPQDQPRNWTQAVSSLVGISNSGISNAQHKVMPAISEDVEVEEGFVPFSVGHLHDGFGQSGHDNVHRRVGSLENLKSIVSSHDSLWDQEKIHGHGVIVEHDGDHIAQADNDAREIRPNANDDSGQSYESSDAEEQQAVVASHETVVEPVEPHSWRITQLSNNPQALDLLTDHGLVTQEGSHVAGLRDDQDHISPRFGNLALGDSGTHDVGGIRPLTSKEDGLDRASQRGVVGVDIATHAASLPPEHKARKLVIHRDDQGRMAAIEEVYT